MIDPFQHRQGITIDKRGTGIQHPRNRETIIPVREDVPGVLRDRAGVYEFGNVILAPLDPIRPLLLYIGTGKIKFQILCLIEEILRLGLIGNERITPVI